MVGGGGSSSSSVALATTTTTTTTPTSVVQRRSRTPRGRFSSPGFSGHNFVSRPPVLLYFTPTTTSCNNSRHVLIQAGHVGQPRPRQYMEVVLPTTTSTDSAESGVDVVSVDTTTADQYYRMYADTLEHTFHLLGQDSKDRRVLVLYGDIEASGNGMYLKRTWKFAITRILQEVIGVPAVSFQPAIHMVPFSLPPPTSISSQAAKALLIVHITLHQAHVLIFANGHLLEYTYQSCGYINNGKTTQQQQQQQQQQEYDEELSMLDVKQMQDAWIDCDDDNRDSTCSLIIAILLALESCPREVRLPAIHNMLFSGTIVDPNFGVRIAKKLQIVLQEPDETPVTKTKTTTTTKPKEEEQQQQPQLLESSSASKDTTTISSWTRVPVNRKQLQPLAPHIAVIQFSPKMIRPDALPWLGASAWAHHWHDQDPDAKPLQWHVFGTNNNNNETTTTTTTISE